MDFSRLYLAALIVLLCPITSAGAQSGGVLSTSAQTPCTKTPGELPWYQKEFCNGNNRLNIPLPDTGLDLYYNSVNCAGGWRLSTDWILRVVAGGAVQVFDPEGKLTLYVKTSGSSTYTALNPLSDPLRIIFSSNSFIAIMPDGTRRIFSPKSPTDTTNYILTSTKDRNENITAIAPIAGGTKITDPYGRTATVLRKSNGEVTSVTGFRGEAFSFTYDAAGRLTKVLYPDGQAWSMQYFDGAVSSNIRTTILPPSGGARVSCLVTSFTAPTEKPISYVYHSDGAVQQVIGKQIVSYDYTPTSVRASGYGRTTLDTYGTPAKLISSEEGGLVTNFTWDSKLNPLRIDAPYGQSNIYSYENGRIKTHLNPSNVQTTYTYSNGRVTQQMIGNARYNFEWETRKDGYYDVLTKIVFPNGTFDRMTYDANGNLLEVFEGAQRVAHYSYDARGNLTQSSSRYGTEYYSYDSFGSLKTHTDEEGRTTAYVFNQAGVPVGKVTPNGFEYVYDQPSQWKTPGRESVYALLSGRALARVTTVGAVFDPFANSLTVTQAVSGPGRDLNFIE